MKITTIRVYQVDLPLVEGRYSWSEGKYVEVFDSTVVELVTDEGLSGYGEVCPLGPFYLPAFGPGARAGIGELSAGNRFAICWAGSSVTASSCIAPSASGRPTRWRRT